MSLTIVPKRFKVTSYVLATDPLTVSTVITFVEVCENNGLVFQSDGKTLTVSPKEKLDEKLRQKIREWKPAIVKYLGSKRAEGIVCRGCGWPGFTYNGLCEMCFDLEVRNEYQTSVL